MAIRTYISGDLPTSNQYVVFVIKIILEEQSIANNNSSGTVQLIFRRTNKGYVTAGAGTVYAQWGGNTYTQSTTINNEIVYATQGAGIVLFSKPFTVQHNAEGKATLTVNGRISIPGANLGGEYQPYTITLPNIARASKTNAPQLTVGESLNVSISSAYVGYTHNLTLDICDGAVVKSVEGVADSAQFSFDASEIDAIYAALPKTTKGAYTLNCETFYNGVSIGSNSENGIVAIDISKALPVFGDFTLSASSAGLTGSDQIIISGISNATITVPVANKATSTTHATIMKYAVSVGDITKEVLYSDSADVSVTINNASNGAIIVSAIDSRGAQTAVTKLFTLVAYTPPRISQARIERNNSIDSEATLSFSGLWWNGSFGLVSNAINARYQYKESNAEEYTAEQPITLAISNGQFQFTGEISGDLGAQGFNIEKSYQVLITVTDVIPTTAQFAVVLDRGIPTMHMTQNGISAGQMMPSGLPEGVVNAKGGFAVNGAMLTESIFPVGTVLTRYDHISPASLFGGTWERIQNTFLYGIPEDGTIGETGGESTHTLTVDELPSHRHSSKSMPADDLTGGYSIMRSDTFSALSDTVSYTAYAGGGAAHNNMPPYVNVSIWRRVA